MTRLFENDDVILEKDENNETPEELRAMLDELGK